MVSLLAALSVFAVLFLLQSAASRDVKRLASGLLGLGVLGLIITAALSKMGTHPLLSAVFQGLWMDTFREDLWRAAIHDLGQAPFFGNGVSSFQWSARIMMPWESILAHNDYLQLLSEYGITGALLLAVVLGLHVFRSSEAIMLMDGANHSSRSQTILTGSFCVVIAQVVHSALDFNMHLAANALPAGFFMGALASSSRVHGEGRSLRLPGLLALAAFSLVAIGFMAAVWNEEKAFLQAGKEYQSVFLPGGPPLSDSARRLLPLLRFSPDNDRYADLGASILMTGMTGESGAFPRDTVFWVLRERLRATARNVPGDWYLWVALARSSGILGFEQQNRSEYIRAMVGLPLYAYPHQEEALIMENVGEIAQALHLHRMGLCLTEPRDTASRVRKLENMQKVEKASIGIQRDPVPGL
jgi:O-antigen ligase